MNNYRIESFDIKAEFMREIVVFDLETTGLDPFYDEIIEIAAVRIRQGEIVPGDCFHSYVKPKRTIPQEITWLTGITNAKVKNAPTAPLALRDFCNFCGESLLIAHNGHMFDMRFLSKACARRQKGFREVDYLDSMHLSWLLWGRRRRKSHSLDSVIKRLGLRRRRQERHRALGDVDLTARSVVELLARIHKNKKGCEIKVYKGTIPT